MHTACTPEEMAAILHDCRFAGGIAASAQSEGFGGNLFTRDSLRVMRDLVGLPGYSSFIREMFGILPQWQGVNVNHYTNEFPDALPHQVFRQIVAGRYMLDARVADAELWASKWGLRMATHPQFGKNLVIYNGSDGPPLYLIALAEYCRAEGAAVLGDKFQHLLSDEVRTVGEAARRCVDFIARAIDERGDGLYSVPSTNPDQTSPSGVMRDGFDGYVRPDGTAIDYSEVAYVEVQALVYEALLVAANELFPADERRGCWLKLAEELRTETIRRFWMEDEHFFGSAIDSQGLVRTLNSTAFELLNGPFFAGLSDGSDYVQMLAMRAYSSEFMTPVGLRMMSTCHDRLEGRYYAYQGSGASWPLITGIVAQALCKQGLCIAAQDQEQRLIAAFGRSGGAPELFYVHRTTNEPLYLAHQRVNPVGGTALAGEPGKHNQAWSASAGLRALLKSHASCRQKHSRGWQVDFQRSLEPWMRDVPPASIFPSSGQLYLDPEAAELLKKKRSRCLGVPC